MEKRWRRRILRWWKKLVCYLNLKFHLHLRDKQQGRVITWTTRNQDKIHKWELFSQVLQTLNFSYISEVIFEGKALLYLTTHASLGREYYRNKRGKFENLHLNLLLALHFWYPFYYVFCFEYVYDFNKGIFFYILTSL